MGVISDAIDALEDWCHDLFKDAVKSQFDGISKLLTETFLKTTGTGASGGLVSDYITQHPVHFTGGASGGIPVWSTIEMLCNNVVVPIGGFVLTVVLLTELCQMVLRGNNCKDFDDSIFIKWYIKALCGVILVANRAVSPCLLHDSSGKTAAGLSGYRRILFLHRANARAAFSRRMAGQRGI